MGVAAAIDCLRGVDRAAVDAVLFASTSYPFKEKQGAAIVAKALDLRRDVYTADVGDSLRAGTNALRTAVDTVKAGSATRVLVVVGDDAHGGAAHARSRPTSATAQPRFSSATTEVAASFDGEPRRRPTRSSTCGAPRAIPSCTPGRTASSSTTATAPACARRSSQGLLAEDGPRAEGHRPARALRPRRAEPRDGSSASSGFDAGAGRRTRSSARSATRVPPRRRSSSPRRSRARRRASGSCVVGYGDGADAFVARDDAESSSGSRGAAASPGI